VSPLVIALVVLVRFPNDLYRVEGFARDLSSALTTASLPSACACLNQYQLFLARKPTVIIFVVSSFLNGGSSALRSSDCDVTDRSDTGPPQNAAKFDEFLDEQLPDSNLFAGVKFAVLGVGHSQWPLFCGFSKKIDARMVELGGQRICHRLDADTRDEDERDVSFSLLSPN
jgi:sulfite reductase alpha subunit-like flavoprotein